MSKENKTVELKDEELEKVSGGDDFLPMVIFVAVILGMIIKMPETLSHAGAVSILIVSACYIVAQKEKRLTY